MSGLYAVVLITSILPVMIRYFQQASAILDLISIATVTTKFFQKFSAPVIKMLISGVDSWMNK
jgi:hypothetical protein